MNIENSTVDMGAVYNHFKTKTPRKILKRSLTELSQKYTLDCTRNLSNKFILDNNYYCPCLLHDGDRFYTTNAKGQNIKVRLQRAHVGISRSNIIEKVLDTYPEETNIIFLLDQVMLQHKTIKLELACQTCNKKLE